MLQMSAGVHDGDASTDTSMFSLSTVVSFTWSANDDLCVSNDFLVNDGLALSDGV